MELHAVSVDKPEDANVVLGQSHFIKTVEDLHEAMATTAPGARFGIAFSEASGPCLVRRTGNDEALVACAVRNLSAIACGHTFLVVMEGAFPVSVLNALKQVPEVCTIFCATANPLEVLVAETPSGRGVVGVVDGRPPEGVETEEDVAERKALLRRFGYKL